MRCRPVTNLNAYAHPLERMLSHRLEAVNDPSTSLTSINALLGDDPAHEPKQQLWHFSGTEGATISPEPSGMVITRITH